MTPARITDRFQVEEIPGADREGRQLVRLLRTLEYRVGHADSPCVVTVPEGFETDFASIPWGLRNLFPPLGRWARPAIVHDWLYATRGDDGRFTRGEADGIFLEAMEVVGVPWWKRTVMYRAVRIGGASGWGRDAPRIDGERA